MHFNPRPPHGRRHPNGPKLANKSHFNPRPPHGRRRIGCRLLGMLYKISIHAPLTGGDNEKLDIGDNGDISIHAPLTGGDFGSSFIRPAASFQSTPPSREATCRWWHGCRSRQDFNPRPPHGRRRHANQLLRAVGAISIHAPLTGGDHL